MKVIKRWVVKRWNIIVLCSAVGLSLSVSYSLMDIFFSEDNRVLRMDAAFLSSHENRGWIEHFWGTRHWFEIGVSLCIMFFVIFRIVNRSDVAAVIKYLSSLQKRKG